MTRIYKRRREDALPTPRTTLRARYVRVLVLCKSCRHQADADLHALVRWPRRRAADPAAVPLLQLRQRPHRLRGDVAGQPAAMVTRSGIPIVYQGQQFPSRKALAEHLAPLLGRSVAALEVALRSHNDNIERVVGGGLVQPSSGKAIPIVYQGQQFPNRAALAKHLAPLVGKTRLTLITLLSRYDGDVERAVAPLPAPAHHLRGAGLPASEGAGGISRSPPASAGQIGRGTADQSQR